MNPVCLYLSERMYQWIASILLGFVIAVESAVPFFIPCLIITVVDVYSAYCLSKRVHKKYPDRSDGKFKSEFKFKILYTMIVAFVAIILANYVDSHVIKDSDAAVRFVLGVFFVYQSVSILENWSSENNNKMAKILQRIVINKAERHLNVDLSDLMDKSAEDEK